MDSEVCCVLEDATDLLRLSYVENLFDNAKDLPKQGHYFCEHGEDQTEDLVVAIMGRLNTPDNLSLGTELHLRAAFDSLVGRWQGIKNHTCFNITQLSISGSAIVAQVFTEHKMVGEIRAPVGDFEEMLSNPLADFGIYQISHEVHYGQEEEEETGEPYDYYDFFDDITGPSESMAPLIRETPLVRQEEKCWCCEKIMVYYVEISEVYEVGEETKSRKRKTTPTAEHAEPPAKRRKLDTDSDGQ